MGPLSYMRSVANRNVTWRIPVLQLLELLFATQHRQAGNKQYTGKGPHRTLPFLSVRHATERGEPITSPQQQEIYVTAGR